MTREKAIPNSFSLPASFGRGDKQIPVTAMVATVPNNNAEFHWHGWGIRDSEIEDCKEIYHTLLNPDLPHREINRIRGSRQGRVH